MAHASSFKPTPGAVGDIVVAVKFDAAAPHLIEVAAAMARRCRRPLRLLHVYSSDYPVHPHAYREPSGFTGFAPEMQRETFVPIPGDSLAGDSVREPERDNSGYPGASSWRTPVEHAREMLREYANLAMRPTAPDSSHQAAWSQTPWSGEDAVGASAAGTAADELVVHSDVLIGDFPETLLEHAAALGAALVITGAAMREPGFMRAKLKHTYRLMAKTALPVLVLKDDLEGTPVPLASTRRPMRVLLTDDLTAMSLPVLASTEALLRLIGLEADVLHLHVEAQPTAGFALSPDYALEVWPGVSIRERLVSEHHERLLTRLRGRAHRLAEQVIAAGGRYRTQLWHGRVEEEIRRAVAVHEADLTVFGQHRFFHRDPLTLGQMPFGAMLNVGSAILVAPPSPV